MLHTFENSQRHHQRQKERARHLYTIERLGLTEEYDPMDLSNVNLAPVVDSLSGKPLARMRGSLQADEPVRQRGFRRGPVYVSLITILISLGIFVSRFSPRGSRNVIPVVDSDSSKLYTKLYSLVLDWGVTPRDTLEDPESPQSKALNWLAFVDAAVVNNGENFDSEIWRTRYALGSFYYATSGENSLWKNEANWLSNLPVCLWHGVECTDSDMSFSRVRSINLTSNGLSGHLPDEISLLGLNLESFDVSFNSLGGLIPGVIGTSNRNLKHLYLGPNLFDSTLPESLFWLTHLTHLYINDCQLKGGIPTNIGKLAHLQGLGLHNNFLAGPIPPSVGMLSDLHALYLDNNQLTGSIPDSIGDLSYLIDLRLGSNNIAGQIPTSIAKLRLLSILQLENNELTGKVPNIFRSLLLLQELWLHNNRLGGDLPSSLDELMFLTTLYLDDNVLQGQIPEKISEMKYLKNLYFFGNNIEGQIPPDLSGMSALQRLYAHNNKLTGTIPDSLSTLPNLKGVSFHHNSLHGSMPHSLCPFSSGIEELTADCDDVECECCTSCF